VRGWFYEWACTTSLADIQRDSQSSARVTARPAVGKGKELLEQSNAPKSPRFSEK